jgi:type VI secretion system protein
MPFFDKFTSRSTHSPENPELVSIIDNLNNILNTKREYGSFLADFGIRDLNEYTSQDHIATAIIDEVKENIEKYEPRVEIINISRSEDRNPFHIAFNIECEVRKNAQSLHMIFDSVFNSVQIEDAWDHE